jgi:hypothetical protein
MMMAQAAFPQTRRADSFTEIRTSPMVHADVR